MHRLSPTFLDSFAYYLRSEGDEKRQELLDRLRGIRREPTEAMQKGIDFEDSVVLAAEGLYEGDDPCVIEVGRTVAGSVWQHHVERELGGVLLHGYLDAFNGGLVFDIKTTGKYEIGKYRNNNQHMAYLYCLRDLRVDHFAYLVTDFKNVYREDYHWTPAFESRLRANVSEFLDYLSVDPEMKEAFENREIMDDYNAKTDPIR